MEPTITTAEFAQKYLIRVRDIKRVLKRHKIGEVEGGVRRFRESAILPLIAQKLARVRQQRSRNLLRTVLAVDDDSANLDMLERALRGECTVYRAADGQEALEVFRSNPIEVVIADQRMPGMSGTEFLIESIRINADTIRILLSAYTDAVALTEAINAAKVHHFLSKPISVDDLLTKVREAFAELTRVRHVQAILLGDRELE